MRGTTALDQGELTMSTERGLRRQWNEMLRKSFHPMQWFSEDRPNDVETHPEDRVMYVYRIVGEGFSVGFYSPNGEWLPESFYRDRDQAASRVHWLNGGNML